MTTNLVVADPERCETTICLAVSPSMKKLGVKNRCRVYEIPKHIEYIKAEPRMQYYINYSAEIYGVYLKYVSKDDIHVYSIDEAFLDVTEYLPLYKMTARELGEKIRQDILETVGIPAACGIGTNLYLAKIALDITAKHSPNFLGELDEKKYRETLWDHKPITDFWRIGRGIAARLESRGIYCMRDVANCCEQILYDLLGVDAEILIDHAWGREPTTIADIKSYKGQSHSVSSVQVLSRNYSFDEGSIIIREMAEQLSLELFDMELVSHSVTLCLSFGDKTMPMARGTEKFMTPTSSAEQIIGSALSVYERIMPKNAYIRKVNITLNQVVEEMPLQFNLFADTEKLKREKKQMQAVIGIKKKFGKNAILRGTDLKSAATARERNRQIGGHKSGEKG
jgi:DNA polymerase V